MEAYPSPSPEKKHHPFSDQPIPGKPKFSGVKMFTFLFPIILALIFLSIKIWLPETYKFIVQEDSVIEYFQAAFFFLASIFAFLIFKRFLKGRWIFHSILYGGLFLGLFFITMEEISWGQRIFNIENPEYFNQNNMQEEISLHNLNKVNNLMSELYIMIGLFGSFGWLFVYGINLKQRIPFVNFYVPQWFISSYFFFVLFTNTLFSYIRPFAVNELGIDELEIGNFFIYRDQEPAELLLSMGFLLFVVVNYFRLKKKEQIKGTIPNEYFNVKGKGKTGKSISTKDRSPVSGANRIKEPLPKNGNKGR